MLRVQVHELLMRVADHELAPVVVLRPEGDRLEGLPASCLLPRLGGRQDRHLHLLAADPVHLLADAFATGLTRSAMTSSCSRHLWVSASHIARAAARSAASSHCAISARARASRREKRSRCT